LEDLNQGVVLPGFSDTHIHAPGLAYDILFNVNLYQALSKEETLGLIKKHVEEHPEREIYYGRGVNSGYFEAEEITIGPRKEHLDRISEDKPIIIADFGGNYLWMNSAAFKKYEITPETISPRGGEIPLDPDDGTLWGIVRGEARALIPYQKFSEEQNYLAAKWFQDRMLSYGYTSIFALRPPGTVLPRTTLFPVFQALEREGELFLRVQGGRDMDPNGNIDEQIEEMKTEKAKYDSEQIRFTTAKFFLDGSIEGLDGCLLQPYGKASGETSCKWVNIFL
jgi:predicted amidohydrolase YtcJ